MLLISIYFQTLFSMLDHNTTEFFAKNLHENKVHFPEERNAFVLGRVVQSGVKITQG